MAENHHYSKELRSSDRQRHHSYNSPSSRSVSEDLESVFSSYYSHTPAPLRSLFQSASIPPSTSPLIHAICSWLLTYRSHLGSIILERRERKPECVHPDTESNPSDPWPSKVVHGLTRCCSSELVWIIGTAWISSNQRPFLMGQ